MRGQQRGRSIRVEWVDVEGVYIAGEVHNVNRSGDMVIGYVLTEKNYTGTGC